MAPVQIVNAKLRIEIEREEDGRFIAEIPELPGVIVHGTTATEAVAKAQALAFRVIADRIDHGETVPGVDAVFIVHSNS